MKIKRFTLSLLMLFFLIPLPIHAASFFEPLTDSCKSWWAGKTIEEQEQFKGRVVLSTFAAGFLVGGLWWCLSEEPYSFVLASDEGENASIKKRIDAKKYSKRAKVEQQLVDLQPDNYLDKKSFTVGKKPNQTVFSVLQVPVLDQMIKGNGGSASCGYQALKNGLLIYKNLDDLEGKNFRLQLSDPYYARYLFGPLNDGSIGIWRKEILKKTQQSALEYYIRGCLLSRLKVNSVVTKIKRWFNGGSDRSRPACRNALNAMATEYSGTLMDGTRDAITIDDSFVKDFVQRYVSTKQDPNLTEERLLDGLDLTGLNHTIHRYMDAIAIYNRDVPQSGATRLNRDGEWISEGDLNYLMQKVDSDGEILPASTTTTQDISKCITVIDDVNLLSSWDVSPLRGIFNQKQDSLESFRKYLNQQKEFKHIFLVGTMKHIGSAGTSGHWFTIVVHKNSDGWHYVLADSLKNKLRVNDEIVIGFIRALHGDEVAKHLVKSPDV